MQLAALPDGNSARNDRYGRILCVAMLYFTIKIIVRATGLIAFYISGRVLTIALFLTVLAAKMHGGVEGNGVGPQQYMELVVYRSGPVPFTSLICANKTVPEYP